MIDEATFQLVYNSYCRCSTSHGFYDDFYDTFMGASEEVRCKFRNTDMKKQQRALDKSLALMVMYAKGNPIACKGLRQVAELHNQRHLNIHPRLYDVWLESLMRAVAKHDKLHSNELELKWREALGIGIDYFRHCYFFGTPYANGDPALGGVLEP